MFRPLPLYVGLRYTRARRRNHFISFITLVSIAGITVGVMALITILSVMNGFERELRERILGMAAHATVTGLGGRLEDWRRVEEAARADPRVLGVAPYVRGEVMLTRAGRVSGALLRGVDPALEPQVSDVGDKMVAGALADLRPGGWGIVLGRELALALGARPGDRVTVVTPQAVATPVGVVPRLRRFTVVGVFEVGMFEYDRGVALVHIDDARRLFRLGPAVTGVRLRVRELLEAPWIARELVARLPGGYVVSDWTREHASFFRAVRTEKIAMFVILSLIVAVAAFNIVSTLVMVVTDKQADIAILRTLGVTPRAVMAIFVVQGTVIGLLGTALGVAAGVALALNVETVVPLIERALGIRFLPPDIYYISDLPSDLHGSDVAVIAAVAFLLSVLATIYPAWRAARVQPAEALRYE